MNGSGPVAGEQLRAIVARIERLEEDKKELAEDIRAVYGEARSAGFDTKILRRVVAMRRIDPAERQEAEALLDLYLNALGMGTGADPAP